VIKENAPLNLPLPAGRQQTPKQLNAIIPAGSAKEFKIKKRVRD
jgi:hypothetical protein